MLTTVTNFFNTSLAALSIYDILVIVLFMVAIVLSIISGIIIISARVKKINTELDKNKNIQNINEKIIQNRLDLIISKLTHVSSNTNNQHFLPLKEVADTPTPEENISAPIDIIKLPPPDIPKTNEKGEEDTDVSEKEPPLEVSSKLESASTVSLEEKVKQDNEIKETPHDQNTNLTSEIENHVINTNMANSSVDITSIDINDDKPTITHEPELITLDTNNIPDSEKVIEPQETIINVSDKYNKSSEINVYLTEEPNPTLNSTDLEQNQNNPFEKAPSIPLAPVSDTTFQYDSEIPQNTTKEEEEEDPDNIYDDIEENYTNPVLQYDENIENENIEKNNVESNPNLKIVNEALNNLNLFSNREKFNITNNISEDGKEITCNVTHNDLPLTYKELTRQLLNQRFINKYNYPEENIEIDYPTTLPQNVTYPADLVVFDDKDRPFIVALIAIPNRKKHFKLLKALAKSLRSPFAVWTDGQNIMFYKNDKGTLEEISYLPEYLNEYDNEENEDSYDSNFTPNMSSQERNSQNITKIPSYPIKKTNDYHYQNSYNSNKVNNFSKDNCNIYRNQPYSLSQEYQQIINKYKKIRNSSWGSNDQPNYIDCRPSITPSTIFNRPLPINNTFNLPQNFSPSMPTQDYKEDSFLINNIRNNFMNRNYPCNNPNLPILPNFKINMPPKMNPIPNSPSFSPLPQPPMHPNFTPLPMPFNPINRGASLNNNMAGTPFLPPQPQPGNNRVAPPPMPINMAPMPPQAFSNPSIPNRVGNFKNPNIGFNHHNLPPSSFGNPQGQPNLVNNLPPQPLPLPYKPPMQMQNNSTEANQPLANSSQSFNSTVNNVFKSYKDSLASRKILSEPQEQRLFNYNIKYR